MSDLADRALDGMLAEGEEELLARRVAEDPEFARAYYEAARFDALLAEAVAEVPAASRRPNPTWRWIPMAAAILLVGLAMWTVFAPRPQDPAPATAQDEAEVAKLIAKLSAEDPAAREEASAELLRRGAKVRAALEKALSGADADLKATLTVLIDRLDFPTLTREREVDWKGWFNVHDHWWTPDGGRFSMGAAVFDTATWARDAELEKAKAEAVSPDGKWMAKSDEKGVTVFPFGRPEEGVRIEEKTFFGPVRFAGNDRIVFVAEREWKGRDGKGSTFRGPTGVLAVAVRADGSWKVQTTLSTGGNVFAVDRAGSMLVPGSGGRLFTAPEWTESECPAGSVIPSPDGRKLAVGSADGTEVSFHAGPGWGPTASVKVPATAVSKMSAGGVRAAWAMEFTGDGRYLAVAAGDRTLRVVRVSDGREVASAPLWGTPQRVWAAPAGGLVIVGCYDAEAKRLTEETARKLQVFRLAVSRP